MSLPGFSTLRDGSRARLQDARYSPKKLVLIHTGIVLLASLLLTAVNFLLDQQISNTGGLSGIGTRSVLTTIQSILQLTQSLVLPFWQIGYTYCILRLSRSQSAYPEDLCQGFRRFGPVLRLKLITGCIYLGIAMASIYIASTLFMFTPWGAALMDSLENLMVDGMVDNETLMELVSDSMNTLSLPMIVLFLISFFALSAPFFYRFRMAEFWLMDHDRCGAMAALRCSRQLMRGNCIALLKIDLHYWWYYLLDILLTAVCYGDVILETVGITLPLDPAVTYFLFFGAYLICQLGLYVWKRNEVSVTYALVYQSLLPKESMETAQ